MTTLVTSSFLSLRLIVVIAGIVGAIQSIIWITMSIIGILAYFCSLDFSRFVGGQLNLGSVFPLTFFEMYFRGNCDQPPNFLELNFGQLQNLNLYEPNFIFGWMWVYLILSLLWFCSSILLILFVREQYIKQINFFLYSWISITMIVSMVDIAMGIFFAIDLNTISDFLEGVGLVGATNSDRILLSAQAVSSVMLMMSFRGFILWIANVSFAIFMFIQSFRIYDFNNNSTVSTLPVFVDQTKDQVDIIDAYNPNKYLYPPNGTNGIPRPVIEKSTLAPFVHDPTARRTFYQHSEPTPAQPRTRTNHNAKMNGDDIVLRRDVANVTREIRTRNSMNQMRTNNYMHPAPDYR